MTAVLAFIYGAALGSFVLVLVERMHVAPALRARSKCLTCGEQLQWTDLIPIVSYLMLGGKCRYCKHGYGVQAISIEILFGVIFTLVFCKILSGLDYIPAGVALVYYTVLAVVLGVMALYDSKHRYIPGGYLAAFILLSVGMFCVRLMTETGVLVLLGPLITTLPFVVLWAVSRGKWIGLGDVIFFFGIGCFFALEQSVMVILISSWIGTVYGLLLALRRRHGMRGLTIPFIPPLVCAFAVVLFTDIDILSFISLIGRVY